ncbi:nuclear transcription factor Y subunit B-1 isoform X1 [Bombyx mandarina]|uniref:Nuclear transcription factor Y subunit B-1 isoform X1 n=1 Tax=Bombyx mandarina TaxID=7092 RepID=A0A6J2JA13_BOMMA|nr:nuclear transcription factor Y subunit B-1 isoform X1 [Bombyx mandarina]
MDSDELGNDLVRLDNGFLVADDTFVVNSDDVLEDENNSDSGSKSNAPLREQDRFLPIANIAKIMKRAIPENGKIAKDARECVQECISEFISFVTSEASDRCKVEKRKTINGEDVLFALNTLGFDNYVKPLRLYLTKYREIVMSPVTINKLNKTIVLYSEDGTACVSNENEIDTQTESTVLYVPSTYPKVVEEFILT